MSVTFVIDRGESNILIMTISNSCNFINFSLRVFDPKAENRCPSNIIVYIEINIYIYYIYIRT